MQPREPAGRRMAGRSSGLCSFCPGGGGALSQGASLRDSVFSPPLGGEGPSSGGKVSRLGQGTGLNKLSPQAAAEPWGPRAAPGGPE